MVSSLVLRMYVSVDWAPLSSITDLWLVRWYFGCVCQWIGLLSAALQTYGWFVGAWMYVSVDWAPLCDIFLLHITRV